jgi:hypothetical protein
VVYEIFGLKISETMPMNSALFFALNSGDIRVAANEKRKNLKKKTKKGH